MGCPKMQLNQQYYYGVYGRHVTWHISVFCYWNIGNLTFKKAVNMREVKWNEEKWCYWLYQSYQTDWTTWKLLFVKYYAFELIALNDNKCPIWDSLWVLIFVWKLYFEFLMSRTESYIILYHIIKPSCQTSCIRTNLIII